MFLYLLLMRAKMATLRIKIFIFLVKKFGIFGFNLKNFLDGKIKFFAFSFIVLCCVKQNIKQSSQNSIKIFHFKYNHPKKKQNLSKAVLQPDDTRGVLSFLLKISDGKHSYKRLSSINFGSYFNRIFFFFKKNTIYIILKIKKKGKKYNEHELFSKRFQKKVSST